MIRISMANLYLYISALILGVPILCGGVVLGLTFWQAEHNVRIWRGEFQMALDQQCPADSADIVGGEGAVYLDAYLLDYQWTNGTLSCGSDGRLIRCSCRDEVEVYTSVSKYAEDD